VVISLLFLFFFFLFLFVVGVVDFGVEAASSGPGVATDRTLRRRGG
jgi:hypothetical protein